MFNFRLSNAANMNMHSDPHGAMLALRKPWQLLAQPGALGIHTDDFLHVRNMQTTTDLMLVHNNVMYVAFLV